MLWTGCDSNDAEMAESPQQLSFDLTAQSNDGAIPDGVGGTVTFWAAGSSTLVTLELDDGATGADVAQPAHIHSNSASEGGDIAVYLSPIDGSGGEGTSARIIDRPIGAFTDFNGHVNVHESVANLGTVVAQGDIGANAEGDTGEGLSFVDDQRQTTYSLAANPNDGSIAPNGLPSTVRFLELTSERTLVTLLLDIDGATGATVSHPAHIHNNSASEGGSIEYYLSPIDGSDRRAQSSKIVDAPYDTLVGFDGHVNVHESVANLGNVVSQGNVGANAGDTEDGGGEGGY